MKPLKSRKSSTTQKSPKNGSRKGVIFFDCYQTLICKNDLPKKVQVFVKKELGISLPFGYIVNAFRTMYERHKFDHPKFLSQNHRIRYYEVYNKELFLVMGLTISSQQAIRLNTILRSVPYVLFPDVLPVLLELRRHNAFYLGIIANWTETLRVVLRELELDSLFDVVYSSHELGVQKPDKKIFEHALAKLSPHCKAVSYYVGDDYELDIIPARASGLTPILVDRDRHYPMSTDCIKIGNLSELPKILNHQQ